MGTVVPFTDGKNAHPQPIPAVVIVLDELGNELLHMPLFPNDGPHDGHWPEAGEETRSVKLALIAAVLFLGMLAR